MLFAASSPHPTPPHPRPEALPPPPGAQAPKLGGLRSFVWGWAQVLVRFPGAVSGSGASGDPQLPPLRGDWGAAGQAAPPSPWGALIVRPSCQWECPAGLCIKISAKPAFCELSKMSLVSSLTKSRGVGIRGLLTPPARLP